MPPGTTNAVVKLLLFDTQGREIVSACRIFRPHAIASVLADSDVLIHGEPLNLNVILNVNEAVAADYVIMVAVFDAKGNEIAKRAVASAGKNTRIEVGEIAKVSLESAAAGIECIVKNLKNGKEAYRVKIPVQIVKSPWNVTGQ